MKVLKNSFIIIGAIIGAGFASGKEIYEYFAKFGVISIIFVILLFFCFYSFINILLNLGQIQKDTHITKINSNILDKGKKFSILNTFMFFTFLILSSAMMSALVALIKTYFPYLNAVMVYAIVIIISIYLSKMTLKKLASFSLLIIPIIIVCICICAVSALSTSTPAVFKGEPFSLLPFLTVAYASQNVFLSSFAIIELGKNLTKNECKKISFTTSLILCALLVVGILCFLLNPQLGSVDLPLVEVAKSINPIFSGVFGLVMFFSILTTYSTSITSLGEFFKSQKKYNKPPFMIMLVVLLSLINFGTIIEYIYPLIGLFGIIYIYSCRKFCQQKQIFLHATD